MTTFENFDLLVEIGAHSFRSTSSPWLPIQLLFSTVDYIWHFSISWLTFEMLDGSFAFSARGPFFSRYKLRMNEGTTSERCIRAFSLNCVSHFRTVVCKVTVFDCTGAEIGFRNRYDTTRCVSSIQKAWTRCSCIMSTKERGFGYQNEHVLHQKVSAAQSISFYVWRALRLQELAW